MSKAVLITGGNLGSVAENLEAAREAISREVGVVERCSSVLESEAWGFEAEERFLNQVLVVATALPPEQLLERCLQIERQLGRVRRPGRGTVRARWISTCCSTTTGSSTATG